MTETLFGYVSAYGLPVVAICAFLSCLAVPIPTFAVMLSAGAFAASGDLVLWQVLTCAYLAALVGDQAGFQIGRWGGQTVISRLKRSPSRATLITTAEASFERWGGTAVFLSRWLFAPLGPWINLMAGAAGLSRARFVLWDAAGEAIWVLGYVMLGFFFGARLRELADLVGDWAGLMSSAGVTIVLGAFLVRATIRRQRQHRNS